MNHKSVVTFKKKQIIVNVCLFFATFADKSNKPCEHIIIITHIYMYFTLLITVILTAVVLVLGAYVIAKLIGPRSYNKVKGEPYECGIPTHGSSWIPVSIGYYLFAILFLMFDIETVFLYPWAVVVKEYGVMAVASIGFFLLVLVFGLAYAWRKGALEWK